MVCFEICCAEFILHASYLHQSAAICHSTCKIVLSEICNLSRAQFVELILCCVWNSCGWSWRCHLLPVLMSPVTSGRSGSQRELALLWRKLQKMVPAGGQPHPRGFILPLSLIILNTWNFHCSSSWVLSIRHWNLNVHPDDRLSLCTRRDRTDDEAYVLSLIDPWQSVVLVSCPLGQKLLPETEQKPAICL